MQPDEPRPTDLLDRPELEFGADTVPRLTALLGDRLDVQLVNYKLNTLRRRVQRRMTAAGIEKLAAYFDRLAEDEREVDALASDLLIGVTAFFRNADAMAALRELVVQPLARGGLMRTVAEGEVLRAWVAGCATGEEAYTVAILLLEELRQAGRAQAVQVLATDVDGDALTVARAGLYSREAAACVPPELIERYFVSEQAGLRVTKALRETVSFAVHDLCVDPPFSRMDLVTCRNVLIYLQHGVQERVLKTLHFALSPGGHLFLGTSETLGACASLFDTVHKQFRLYRKVGSSPPLSMRPMVPRIRQTSEPSERSRARGGPMADLAVRALLDVRVPPSVVVGPDGTVLYAHGELGPYLQFPPGEPRLDLGGVLRPDLVTRVRGAVYQARRDGVEVAVMSSPEAGRSAGSYPAEARAGESGESVRIRATPVPSLGDGITVLSFEPAPPTTAAPTDSDGPILDAERVIAELETELAATREDLRITVEELQGTNEELRASHEEAIGTNEELQSTNEELEATTEELRSLNEELSTVNQQLHDKIAELAAAHDDLQNFFASTKLATVFLDLDLRVKRFTPAAEDLLGLSEGDLGRKTARQLQVDLADEAAAVLSELTPRSSELRLPDGRWFVRRILPYRTKTQRIDGVVVTLVDVTSLRATTDRLAAREREQAVLARLGTRALAETDLDAFMDLVVRELQAAVGAAMCGVHEIRPSRGEALTQAWSAAPRPAESGESSPSRAADFVLRAGVGFAELAVGQLSTSCVPESPHGQAAASGQPVVVQELGDRDPALAGAGVVSGIVAPIVVGGRVWGILGTYERAGRAFATHDVQFVESVAHVLAAAIQQVLAARRLALERGVAQVLYDARTIDDAMGRIFAVFARELDVAVGECWVPVPGNPEELECRWFAVPDEPHREKRLRKLLASETLRRGEGLIGRVYDQGSAVAYGPPDAQDTPRLLRISDSGLASGYSFAIIAGPDPVGVMSFLVRRVPTHDDQLLRTLDAVGREIGELFRRIEAEEALRETETRNAAILDLALDGLVIMDAAGRVIEFNRAAERLFERSRAEAVGQPMAELLIPPGQRERHLRSFQRHLESGRTSMLGRRVELTALRRDGNEFPAELAVTRVDTGSGPIFAAFVRDLTERRRAEEAVRASEERFRRIFSSIGVAVFEEDFTLVVKDIDAVLASGVADFRSWLDEHPEFVTRMVARVRITDVNDEAIRMLRAPSKEALLTGLSLLFVPDTLEVFRAQLETIAARRTTMTAETVVQRLNGERLDVLITVRFPFGSTGFDQVLVSMMDVSDRNRAERARQLSEWRFNQLVRTSPVPMLVFDDTGRIQSASRSWSGVLGIPLPVAATIEGWTQQAVVGGGEAWLTLLRNQFDGDGPVHGELELLAVTGPKTLLFAGASLGVASDGHRLRLFAATDITERQRTERALREGDRQKDQFIAMLGHELRNPLTAIRAAHRLLALIPSEDERLGRTVAILERQTTHMARLLDGLLDVSRIVSGKIALERQPVNLRKIVTDLLEDRGPDLGARNARVESETDELWLTGDPVRLGQIVDNLLSNAVKFTPEGGVIRIGLRTRGRMAELVVSDDGLGIEADLLPYLFQPFRQAAQPLDRAAGGLGLGLALVKGLVELHGGTVHAHSDGPGRGSTFVVRLPTDDAVEPPPVIPPIERVCRRILVVEDNLDAAHLMGELLRSSGHEVALAHDGPQALALAAEYKPEVVICDIGLPGGMSGYAVARELRKGPGSEAILIALTGYGRPEDRADAEAAGFDHHLTKPVDLDQVERLIAR